MNFMIAGAFSKFNVLSKYIMLHQPQKRHQIVVYDGINNCAWNGGRINRDISFKDYEIDFYYKRGINIALTFSNPIIDISDETGNKLLQKFHKTGNCIILINDNLRKYIRKRYPKYTLIYSITGLGDVNIPMKESDIQRYKRLEKLYDIIVPRMEHVFDENFIVLEQDKYEIMLNDTCIVNCPFYKEHFEAIAKNNTYYQKPWEERGHDICYNIEECWIKGFNPDIDAKGQNGMDITIQQIDKLYDRGIRYFKITGRELNDTEFTYELEKYL